MAVILPPDAAANSLNFINTQLRAAPIPLDRSVVELTVLRVPKDTIFLIYDCSESALTSLTIPAISGSRSIVVWASAAQTAPDKRTAKTILFICFKISEQC